MNTLQEVPDHKVGRILGQPSLGIAVGPDLSDKIRHETAAVVVVTHEQLETSSDASQGRVLQSYPDGGAPGMIVNLTLQHWQQVRAPDQRSLRIPNDLCWKSPPIPLHESDDERRKRDVPRDPATDAPQV